MTAILGISAFYHDSAAALVRRRRDRGGRAGGALHPKEARRRLSRTCRSPTACDEAGLKPEQLDYVVLLREAAAQVRAAAGDVPGLRAGRLSQLPHGHAAVAEGEAVHAPHDSAARSAVRPRSPLVFTDHHESHAASAFFPSPFDEAAILTLDGVGEWSTTTLGVRPRQHRSR